MSLTSLLTSSTSLLWHQYHIYFSTITFYSPFIHWRHPPSIMTSIMTSLTLYYTLPLLCLYYDVTHPLLWRHCPLLSIMTSLTLYYDGTNPATMTALSLYYNVTHPLLWRHAPSIMTSLSLYYTLPLLCLYYDVTHPLLWRHSPSIIYYDVTHPLLWRH